VRIFPKECPWVVDESLCFATCHPATGHLSLDDLQHFSDRFRYDNPDVATVLRGEVVMTLDRIEPIERIQPASGSVGKRWGNRSYSPEWGDFSLHWQAQSLGREDYRSLEIWGTIERLGAFSELPDSTPGELVFVL
jgi:hypothetical protein